MAMPETAADSAGPNPSLDRARMIVVAIALGMTVVWFFVVKVKPQLGWQSGLVMNLLQNALFVIFAWKYRDGLFPRLMLFGLCVGLAELVTDAWEVDGNKTLIYDTTDGPMIWRSPAWMPLAWETTSVELGYIGMRLYGRLKVPGLLLAGLIGALIIPSYESLARNDHLWEYVGCRHMLFNAPWYIIATEFLCTMVIALGAGYCLTKSWLRPAVAGVVAGLGILPCAMVSYGLVEKLL